MMTAPSTISPKSMAPSDIRLPLIFPCTMPVTVISIENGMARAVMIAARMLSSMRNRTTTTRIAPSARFFSTVLTVAFTSFVRL